MSYFVNFLRNDWYNVRRDSLLVYMFTVPWIIVLLLRLIIPPAEAWFYINYKIILEHYYPLILSFLVILQVPMVFGLIFGLMLLDEKDEGVLTVMQITPASLKSYIYYRFIFTMVFSMVYVFLILYATGMTTLKLCLASLPVMLIGGLLAVLMILFITNFANNKVEGLALMKGLGILMLGPLAAYFWHSPWQAILGILPSYWLAKAYWVISSGDQAWNYIVVGLFYHLLLFFILYRQVEKKIWVYS